MILICNILSATATTAPTTISTSLTPPLLPLPRPLPKYPPPSPTFYYHTCHQPNCNQANCHSKNRCNRHQRDIIYYKSESLYYFLICIYFINHILPFLSPWFVSFYCKLPRIILSYINLPDLPYQIHHNHHAYLNYLIFLMSPSAYVVNNVL